MRGLGEKIAEVNAESSFHATCLLLVLLLGDCFRPTYNRICLIRRLCIFPLQLLGDEATGHPPLSLRPKAGQFPRSPAGQSCAWGIQGDCAV